MDSGILLQNEIDLEDKIFDEIIDYVVLDTAICCQGITKIIGSGPIMTFFQLKCQTEPK